MPELVGIPKNVPVGWRQNLRSMGPLWDTHLAYKKRPLLRPPPWNISMNVVDLIYLNSTYRAICFTSYGFRRAVYTIYQDQALISARKGPSPPNIILNGFELAEESWNENWNEVSSIHSTSSRKLSKRQQCNDLKSVAREREPQHDERSERVVANWRNIGARTCFTGTRDGWGVVNVIKGTAIIVLRLMIISF